MIAKLEQQALMADSRGMPQFGHEPKPPIISTPTVHDTEHGGDRSARQADLADRPRPITIAPRPPTAKIAPRRVGLEPGGSSR